MWISPISCWACSSTTVPEVRGAAQEVLDAIQRTLVTASTVGWNLGKAAGIAIYFPQLSAEYSRDYETLAFAQATRWDEMLVDYIRKQYAWSVREDLDRGDPASLRAFVAGRGRADAGPADPGIARDLLQTLRFQTSTERAWDASLRREVDGLLDALAVQVSAEAREPGVKPRDAAGL